jgi:hypothetical protein
MKARFLSMGKGNANDREGFEGSREKIRETKGLRV